VVILASRSLPKRFTDALQPWGLEALTEYRPDYLSGFRAEGYTVDLDDGMGEARGIMDARIRATSPATSAATVSASARRHACRT
jgi:hypothetical protein